MTRKSFRILAVGLWLLAFGCWLLAESNLFEITPKQGSARSLVIGASVWVVHQTTLDSLQLSEYSGEKAGTYYRINMDYGLYRIYINGTLVKSNHPFGVDRTYDFIEAVDSDEDNLIETAGLENDVITNAKLADNAVAAANIVDSVITKAKITNAFVQWVESAGGGSIVNNPDDVTIRSTIDSTLEIHPDYTAARQADIDDSLHSEHTIYIKTLRPDAAGGGVPGADARDVHIVGGDGGSGDPQGDGGNIYLNSGMGTSNGSIYVNDEVAASINDIKDSLDNITAYKAMGWAIVSPADSNVRFADYETDGLDDHVQINAAYDMGFSRIYLTDGAYSIGKAASSGISFTDLGRSIHLKAGGWNTYMQMQDSADANAMINVRGQKSAIFENFRMSANADSNSIGLCISASDNDYVRLTGMRGDSSAIGHIFGLYGNRMAIAEKCSVNYTPTTSGGHAIDLDKDTSTGKYGGTAIIDGCRISNIGGSQSIENYKITYFTNNTIIVGANSQYGTGLNIGSSDTIQEDSCVVVQNLSIYGGGMQINYTDDTCKTVTVENVYMQRRLQLGQAQIENLIIRNMTIDDEDGTDDMINLPQPTYSYLHSILLEDVKILHVPDSKVGIKIQGTGNVKVIRPIINNCFGTGIQAYANLSAKPDSLRLLIQGAEIYAASSGTRNGIDITGGNRSSIKDSKIIGMVRGIELEGDYHTIKDNIIDGKSVGGTGIRVYSGAEYNTIKDNIIDNYGANLAIDDNSGGRTNNFVNNSNAVFFNKGTATIPDASNNSGAFGLGLTTESKWTKEDIRLTIVSALYGISTVRFDSVNASQGRIYGDTSASGGDVKVAWEINAGER